ncbi:Na+/H+ antiporter subunit E [Desulfovibrio oxyclinae]|jgi:multicomponent Na+:H+ antiporter subunit E|uniref:Na+/H+ antiporter subunit E n=1 Tax=Desulfovibrio oxyclinae TaxID=63560 RepID=UPI0003705D40|nr:Na+/H+ antiporter subunit E [Desulfovibrio oxyclinae]
MSLYEQGITVTKRPDSVRPKKPGLKSRIIGLGFRFLALMAMWALLSGMYDAFHLSLGVFCCALVTWLSMDMFPAEGEVWPMSALLRSAVRVTAYAPWLIWQIVVANVRMLRLAFHPNPKKVINPRIVTFKTRLRSKLALTMLANSITLTPGTITVMIDERGYVAVHSIDDASAEGMPGEMERKIKDIFEVD